MNLLYNTKILSVKDTLIGSMIQDQDTFNKRYSKLVYKTRSKYSQ